MEPQEAKLRRLKTYSALLDSRLRGPFGIRYGLDPLIGLIPVLGDLITTLLSLYIIAVSFRMGCSLSIILRMIFNVVIENIFGIFPFLGNIFDFYWKANNKNVALLEDYLHNPLKVSKRSDFVVALVFSLFFLLFALTTVLSIWIFVRLLDFITRA